MITGVDIGMKLPYAKCGQPPAGKSRTGFSFRTMEEAWFQIWPPSVVLGHHICSNLLQQPQEIKYTISIKEVALEREESFSQGIPGGLFRDLDL